MAKSVFLWFRQSLFVVLLERVFFKDAPDLTVAGNRAEATVKTKKKKKRQPDYRRIVTFVLGLLLLSLQQTFQEKAEEAFLREQQRKEYTLQNLINVLYTGGTLTEAEQAELCSLLWEVKGISLANCHDLSSADLLQAFQANEIDYRVALGEASTVSYRKTFFSAYPYLKDSVYVHHAIEQSVLTRYPDMFTKNEIHSLSNLRGIPISLNSDLHLSKIRKEWTRFYKQNPNATKEQIIDKATEIDNIYGELFKPPLQLWK